MSLNYELEKESGVKIAHWEVGEIKVSILTGKVEVQFLGFVSQELKNEGKGAEIIHYVNFVMNKEDEKLTSFFNEMLPLLEAKFLEDKGQA